MPKDNLILSRIIKSVEEDLSFALSQITKFNIRYPEDLRGWHVRASILLRKNDAAGLKHACTQALQVDNSCVISRSLLGLASALNGEYSTASMELQRVCSISPTEFYQIELGTYLHLSGNTDAAFRRFISAKKLSENKKSIRNMCLSIYGAIRSTSNTREKTEYLSLKKELLTLYQKRPNFVSSVIINYFNTRDFFKWRFLKEKDELALFFQNNSSNIPHELNVPKGFVLPKQDLALRAFQNKCSSQQIFIAKETGLFGGQGITLHSREYPIPKNLTGVVQSYIDNPLLIGGRKAHMRLYIILLSYRPLAAFFWKNGIVRIAPEDYLRKKGWLSNAGIHITNTALNRNHKNIKFSDNPGIENDGSIWGLVPYIDYVSANQEESRQIWDRLHKTAAGFVNLLNNKGFFNETSPIPNRALMPKIIGFDALLDADKKVWFLEIQRNPGQTGKGPINRINAELYRSVFETTIKWLEHQLSDNEVINISNRFIPIRN